MDRSLLRLRPILREHFLTLRYPRGSPHLRDYLGLLVLPTTLGLLAVLTGVKISVTTAAALVTVTGILAAFFFQLSVQLLNRAIELAHSNAEPSRETSEYANLLMTLSANSLYSALVSVSAVVAALLAGTVSNGRFETALVFITITIAAHLLWTMLLVISRVFHLTRERLIVARTGDNT